MSALHLACSHCLKDCVEYLLALAATSVNEADVFGMLPLHHAISMCKTQVALEGELDGLRSSSDSLRTSSDFSITQNDLPTAEAVVSLLLDNGAQVNLTDCCASSRPPSYTTPLCFAVDIGNVRVVETLLKAGGLVNPVLGRGDGGCPKHCPPLQCALDNTDLVLAAMLVQHGARCTVKLKDDSYLIHHYCMQGNLPAVQFLLSHDVAVNQIGGQRKHTPLQVAALHGHANIMELLLARGAVISSSFSTQLLIGTVFSGSVAAVQLLLEHGVSVNSLGSFNRTALYEACNKSVDMVKMLLSAGADPNLGGGEHKPVCNLLHLHRRVVADSVDIVRELLLHNADMDVPCKEVVSQQHLTLLHRGLLCGEGGVVAMLLTTAAARTQGITDNMLRTFRAKCMHPHAVELLQYHMRNPYSLAQLCRTAIRGSFRRICHLQELPLPPPLIDYLLMTELIH